MVVRGQNSQAGLAQWIDASCPWLAVSEDSVLLPSIAWVISLQQHSAGASISLRPLFFFRALHRACLPHTQAAPSSQKKE